MNPNQVNVYETHSWSMKPAGYNRIGEPTYAGMCEKCGSSTWEIRQNNKTCDEVLERVK